MKKLKKLQKNNFMNITIPVVNEQDEIIYYKEVNRSKKILPPGSIYRVSGLWIKDKDGNILLAQRSFNKKHSPGLWGPAVTGTIEKGETYEENIIKEAEEEIGLTNHKFKIGPKMRRSGKNEYFIQWFIVVVDHDYNFVKQDEEVEKIKWLSRDELKDLLSRKPEAFLSNLSEYIKIL